MEAPCLTNTWLVDLRETSHKMKIAPHILFFMTFFAMNVDGKFYGMRTFRPTWHHPGTNVDFYKGQFVRLKCEISPNTRSSIVIGVMIFKGLQHPNFGEI